MTTTKVAQILCKVFPDHVFLFAMVIDKQKQKRSKNNPLIHPSLSHIFVTLRPLPHFAPVTPPLLPSQVAMQLPIMVLTPPTTTHATSTTTTTATTTSSATIASTLHLLSPATHYGISTPSSHSPEWAPMEIMWHFPASMFSQLSSFTSETFGFPSKNKTNMWRNCCWRWGHFPL